MQEVLFKPDKPTVPLKELEFYELQICDPNSYTSDFVVMQSRATWSEVVGQFMFDEIVNWRSAGSFTRIWTSEN